MSTRTSRQIFQEMKEKIGIDPFYEIQKLLEELQEVEYQRGYDQGTLDEREVHTGPF